MKTFLGPLVPAAINTETSGRKYQFGFMQPALDQPMVLTYSGYAEAQVAHDTLSDIADSHFIGCPDLFQAVCEGLIEARQSALTQRESRKKRGDKKPSPDEGQPTSGETIGDTEKPPEQQPVIPFV